MLRPLAHIISDAAAASSAQGRVGWEDWVGPGGANLAATAAEASGLAAAAHSGWAPAPPLVASALHCEVASAMDPAVRPRMGGTVLGLSVFGTVWGRLSL